MNNQGDKDDMWLIWREQDMNMGFWWEKLNKENTWEDPGADGIKMGLHEMGWEDTDWYDLAQGRKKWLALAHMVMNQQGS